MADNKKLLLSHSMITTVTCKKLSPELCYQQLATSARTDIIQVGACGRLLIIDNRLYGDFKTTKFIGKCYFPSVWTEIKCYNSLFSVRENLLVSLSFRPQKT